MRLISTDQLREVFSGFAAAHIALRAEDLQAGETFPLDIWQAMGEAGLFKLGIEKADGGSGGGYRDLATAGESLARNGHSLGLALSWIYQQLVARYLIQGFGSEEQRRQYLTGMAQGELTTSFAVSEPQHGAHPKLLATAAKEDGNTFILNGAKTYLTNGPIARLFIVIAVTDDQPPRKRFTAFLIPRKTPGLTVADPMIIPFLKPSPHGGISLQNCRLPRTAILGEKGEAYQRMVIPFGEIEDAVLPALVLGSMERQMELFLITLHTRREAKPDAPLHNELGALAASLETLRTVVYEGAARLDLKESPSLHLTLAFTELAGHFQDRLAEIITRLDLDMPAAYHHLQSDLASLTSLRKRALQTKREKLGAALLSGFPAAFMP